MDNEKIRIIMLCGNGQSSRIMYNGLAPHVNIECIVLENKPSAKKFIQRRIKKLGIIITTGQLLFLVVNKLLSFLSKKRINQLISIYGLNVNNFPPDTIKKVNSVNNEETISLLVKLDPDAIVVNGTRIISNKVLTSVDAPFINTHMGITPKYRGVHGGYWAMANRDPENCGVTVHLVDEGIDTGGVLYHDKICVDKQDNINTIPIHQIAKAIPLMKEAIIDVKEKRIDVKQGVLPSKLWFHPTLFQYIINWVVKRVR